MLKAAGVVFVMAASFAIGYIKRGELARRLSELNRLKWELGRIRAKIQGCGLSLEDCFRESGIFCSAAEKIKNGVPAGEAVMDCGPRAEGLALFAAGLEAETVEGQLRNIDIFLESLESDIAAAREELDKKGRMCIGLGILSGAAVCIMLI
ncbi:MAG: stage III sporulation protein AB [Clostridia bacterium]